MKLPNEKNSNKRTKANFETIKKANLSQEEKLLNSSYLKQLEANNHYFLGYNKV